jgi:hypothetical protein
VLKIQFARKTIPESRHWKFREWLWLIPFTLAKKLLTTNSEKRKKIFGVKTCWFEMNPSPITIKVIRALKIFLEEKEVTPIIKTAA